MPSRRLFALFLLVSALATVLSAQSADEFLIPSAESGGLGGPHGATGVGFEALFSNPAGLAGSESQFSLSELTISSRGPVFSIASLVIQAIGGADVPTLLLSPDVQSLLQSLSTELEVLGPLSFGYVGDGMGYGIYNSTELLVENVGISDLEARLGERFVFRGGYGLTIPLPESSPDRFTLGIGIKGFVRGDVVIGTSLLALPSLIGSLGPDLLATSPFELQSGIGLDLGARYNFGDVLAASLTVEDLYAPTARLRYTSTNDFLGGGASPAESDYQTLPQRINLGLAYTPDLGVVSRYVQDLTVLFDYRDIFDFWINPSGGENLVLKFGIGVEATLLEILAIRGGFSDGLYAAGLGLDLSVVELNAAMYGSELSGEPGLRPQYNIVIGLEFRN